MLVLQSSAFREMKRQGITLKHYNRNSITFTYFYYASYTNMWYCILITTGLEGCWTPLVWCRDVYCLVTHEPRSLSYVTSFAFETFNVLFNVQMFGRIIHSRRHILTETENLMTLYRALVVNSFEVLFWRQLPDIVPNAPSYNIRPPTMSYLRQTHDFGYLIEGSMLNCLHRQNQLSEVDSCNFKQNTR